VIVYCCTSSIDAKRQSDYHDFGPVVADGLCLADSSAVEIEYPIQCSHPRTSFDVAAHEHIAVADER